MDQEKTYKWVQDRLHDLHSGTLSDEDRLRMEEMSNVDPFIRDALEGYKAHADHDHSLLLKLLSERIQTKSATRRTKLLPLSRGWVLQAVAASFVLILATWAVIYYIDKQDDVTTLAGQSESSPSTERSTEVELTYPESMKDDIATGTTPEDGMNEPAGLRANAMSKAGGRQGAGNKEQGAEGRAQGDKASSSDITNETRRLTNDEGVQPESEATYATSHDADNYVKDTLFQPAPPSSWIEIAETAGNMKREKKSFEAATDHKALRRDESYFANQMSPERMAQRITGQILSISGQPLIGALLNIPNTNLVTTTDDYGRFEFYLPHANSNLEVNYSGYQDTTVTVLPGQGELVIMLEETIQSIQSAQAIRTETKLQKPGPENSTSGHSKAEEALLLTYLQNNSNFPLQNKFSPTGKSVTLEFNISPNKRPQKIKIIDASGDNRFDDESIRLIKHGPDWSCEEGSYPCMKRYTIYFE